MAGIFVRNRWIQCLIYTLLLFIVTGTKVSAETNILPGTPIQPPTRFLWVSGGTSFFFGRSEETIRQQEAVFGTQFFSSPEGSLDEVRQRACTTNNGLISFECNENEEVPGYNGWFWRFSGIGIRANGSNALISDITSKFGVCPVNLDPSKPGGYSLINVPDPSSNLGARGYIACPVPSYPDGEKDLAKPQECGDKTPNPVHIGLGRKEITIPIYSAGNNVFPIDFQLYYQHWPPITGAACNHKATPGF